jgi:hypothetical protein
MKTNLDNTEFNHNGEIVSGDVLEMRQSRLKKELEAGTISPSDKEDLDEISKKLQDARNIINSGQKVTQVTNPNNTYQKEKSVTAVPTVVSNSHSKTTSNSKVLPISALKEEIQKIKHLIEYHNNNNK